MQTMKLFAYQQPSRVEMLLESLVIAKGDLPGRARKVSDRSDLPSAMQKLVMQAQKSERVWSAWTGDDERMWLFIAEMSMALSRERGCPALQVGLYNEHGKMQEWKLWVNLKDGSWQQCTL